MSRFSVPALGMAVALATLVAAPASAMTLKECSIKYQAAKKDGSLGTRNWSDYRQAECGVDKSAGAPPADPAKATADAAKPAATAASVAAAPAKPATTATPPSPASSASATAGTAAAAPADLPTVVDPQYAAEKPARARLHTCSDSYRAHKKAGTLGGLKWLEKGGGFYSLCNRKLKAAG